MGALAIRHLVGPLAGLHAQVLEDLLDGLWKGFHGRQLVSVLQFVLLAQVFPRIFEVGLVHTLQRKQ